MKITVLSLPQLDLKMIKVLKIMSVVFSLLFLSMRPTIAYEVDSYPNVMKELQNQNQQLFKIAERVYKYATGNTTDIIEKPLLVRHNKGLNGFIDRKNKVSAKYFGVGSDGLKSKLIMLFKFGDKKYKVIEHYVRDSKYSRWEALN